MRPHDSFIPVKGGEFISHKTKLKASHLNEKELFLRWSFMKNYFQNEARRFLIEKFQHPNTYASLYL